MGVWSIVYVCGVELLSRLRILLYFRDNIVTMTKMTVPMTMPDDEDRSSMTMGKEENKRLRG